MSNNDPIILFALVLLGLAAPLIMQVAKWLSAFPLPGGISGTWAEVTFGLLSVLLAAGWLWLQGQLTLAGQTPLELVTSIATVGVAIWGIGTTIYLKFKPYMPGPKTI